MNTNRRDLRIVVYAQHLSGVGHYVRALEIAAALGQRHGVWITDGGRPVPRRERAGVERLELPRICRVDDRLQPVEPGLSFDRVMALRGGRLRAAMHSIRPDVVVIEHYPFSKWELEPELDLLLACARQANPGLKVVCSLRDIAVQTRHETCGAEAYASTVLDRLHARFDGLMVHADPALIRLEDSFPAAVRIRIPAMHTGVVAEAVAQADAPDGGTGPPAGDADWIIASAGGGRDAARVLEAATAAWHLLRRDGALGGHRLALFGALDARPPARACSGADDRDILRLGFRADFLRWMGGSRLSISCAGYNTVANVLRTGCRAILIPNPGMSDQAARSSVMQALGASVLGGSPPDPGLLAEAMLQVLALPPPRYAADLGGAVRSRDFVESVAA